MLQRVKAKTANSGDAISEYGEALTPTLRAVTTALRDEIEDTVPKAVGKIWHGAPVWFLGEHPILGYSLKAKTRVSLLFWNGQSFDEPTLKPAGKFKAAEVLFTDPAEIDHKVLRRQLRKAKTMLWDYEGIPENRRPKSKARTA
jgi:hypothetical protein